MIELLTTLMMLQVTVYRIQNGMDYVPTSEETCTYAEARLKEIRHDWTHEGFYRDKEGTGFWTENLGRVVSSRGEYAWNAGEVFKMWQLSPKHNQNLLAKVDSMCIKMDGDYFVMIGYGKGN